MTSDAVPFLPPVQMSGFGLTLRPLRAEDAEPLLETCRDLAVAEWTTVPQPYSLNMAQQWCAAPPGRAWAIAADEAELAFCGQIELRVHSRSSVSMGYMTAPWARGRGLMTSAVKLVRDYAFASGVQRAELCIHPANAGSLRVAEKAGFVYEGIRRNGEVLRGEVRDLAVYSSIPSDLDADGH